MKTFVLGTDAAKDQHEIWEFIARDNVDAADRLLEKLYACFQKLAAHPEIGHVRTEWTELPVRFWSLGAYLIVYRIRKNTPEIVGVFHGARNLPELLPLRSSAE